MAQEDVFKKLVSHCKEYGFVFPSSEIYDGLGAVYDYGQMGVELKNNIKQYWWQSMVLLNENIVGIDSAIFMHPTIWKASGHVDAFNDPLIDNRDSKKRYRADVLIEDQLAKYDEKINKEVSSNSSKRYIHFFVPFISISYLLRENSISPSFVFIVVGCISLTLNISLSLYCFINLSISFNSSRIKSLPNSITFLKVFSSKLLKFIFSSVIIFINKSTSHILVSPRQFAKNPSVVQMRISL